jgi:hypothetical protein
MTVCTIHGRGVGIHASRDIAWAMCQSSSTLPDSAVVMLIVDQQAMLTCILSQDVIRHYNLASGPIGDKAAFAANDGWIHQLVPACSHCLLERFGSLPNLVPTSTNSTGYCLVIHPYPSSLAPTLQVEL